MFKKCVIFFFLAIAYSVLLAHNFTPHHHAEQSDHHEHNGHVHTHNPDEKKDAEDNSNPFQHFDHIGATEIQYLPVYFENTIKEKQTNPTFFRKEIVIGLPRLHKPPPKLTHRPREESWILTQSLAYFFSLTAPPAISIA